MKVLRKVVFWCHLTAGVFAGLVVLVMSVTGVLLAYERQITSWADTRGYRVEAAQGAARLPAETLISKARESRQGTPTSLTIRAGVAAPAEVSFGREGTVFVNPYTGEVLGGGSQSVRSFFRAVTNWHRWLGASGEGSGRTVGRAVTGASNLAFLFLVVSGFYLWWPRTWTWKSLRGVTWFRRGLAGRARNFNWHNTAGFWAALPLFVVVLSAVVISYTWAGNLVYRVVGETPPAPPQRAGAPGGGQQQGANTPAPLDGLGSLLARAERQVEGWRSITLQLPQKADAPVVFAIDRGDGGQPQARATLALDRKSGEVVRWEPFSSLTAGRRLRSILRFAHTGEVLGLFGQTVALIASAAGALLVWTGLALAWRRFRGWSARRAGRVRGDAPTASTEAAAETVGVK